MANTQKISTLIAAFGLVVNTAATPAEAAFAPNGAGADRNHASAPASVRYHHDDDPCAGEQRAEECRAVKERTDAAMLPIELNVNYKSGLKACYAGLGAKAGGDYYLRSFSKVACGVSVVNGNVIKFDDVEEAFAIKENPRTVITLQPFSPDDNQYEGVVGRFVLVGSGSDGANVHIDCGSSVIVKDDGVDYLLFPNCD